MKESSSCKSSINRCLENKTFSFAHLYNDEKTMNIHIHNCYEIYYSISGARQFLIDNYLYDIKDGDIFFINQFESHYVRQVDKNEHERIVISIYPEYLKENSTKITNLENCFQYRNKDMPHKIHLNKEEQKIFIYFIHKLHTNQGFGEDILDKSIFLELMVFLNKIFEKNYNNSILLQEKNKNYNKQIDDIISYINKNISENISLEDLSNHFYLSPSYICRIFKSATGTTINKYITAKRISISKSLLSQGYSVNEAWVACGFNDYSNYLKAFTKAVGISPKKYTQLNS